MPKKFRFSTVILLCFIFVSIFLFSQSQFVWADTVSFSVQGQNFSFDTGDGRDGDVNLQLNGDILNVAVNGTPKGQMTRAVSISPGLTLTISTSSTSQSYTSSSWAPSGYNVKLARFTGSTISGDNGYLDAYIVNNWVQLAQFIGSWDKWILVPEGTTQLRVRLITSSTSGSRNVSVPEVIGWPSSVLNIATQSLNNALYVQATATNQSLTQGPWAAPAGRYILGVQFKGNTRSGQHYGYLDAYINGSWQQIAQRSGTWDEVITLPIGASQIRVRLTTNSQSLVSPTYADVPMVSLGNTVVTGVQTVTTGNSLYISTSAKNQDITKTWWISAGKTPVSVHFKGNTYSGQHYGYLYIYVGESWRLIDQRSGSWDTWVRIPTGITGIRVRLTTSDYTPVSGTYVDVPEVLAGTGITTEAVEQVVLKNVMELDGRPLSQRSDLKFTAVKMETLVKYLPSTTSYSPTPSANPVSTGGALSISTSSANQDITKEWSPASGQTIRKVRFTGTNNSYTSGSSTTYYYNYLYAQVNGDWILIEQNRGSYNYWVTLPRGTTALRVRVTTGANSYSGTIADVPEVVLGYPVEGVPSSLGTVPQFNNLTVGSGIMLTSDTHIAFKVKGTLTVSGVIQSNHGPGAPATSTSTVNGEDAYGDVMIVGGMVVVAPNGTTGEKGAILAGWGGGGGSYQTYAGNGGSGSNVYIYANCVVNRGEIRAGNGGGGGAWRSSSSSGYGKGGYAGNTILVASVLEGGGVIASGLSGADGGNVSSSNNRAGAGYGGGGLAYYDNDNSRWINGPGGTGGAAGTNGAGAGFEGTSGTYGNKSVGYSREDGALIVKVKRLVEISGISARFYVGYSTGGWMGSLSFNPSQSGYVGVRNRKTVWVDEIAGNPAISVGSGMYVPRNYDQPFNVVSVVDFIILGTPQSPVNVTIKDLYFAYLTVNGNANFTGNLYFIPSTVMVTGNATFAPSSYIYAKCDVHARFQVGGNISVKANIAETRWYTLPLGDAGGTGDLWETSYVSFIAGGDIRFGGNSNYLSSSWWRTKDSYGNYFRTVIANNITMDFVRPSLSVSGFGATILTFEDWVSKYSSLERAEFKAERKGTSGSWIQVSTFTRNLTGTPEWYDVNTPLREDLYYRVGFRAAGASTGFVWFDDAIVGPVYSEGSALADEEPPQIQVFTLNGGITPASLRYVPVELVVTDNRTQAQDLLVQFEVNGTRYYYDGAAWRQGDGWGSYTISYSGLDLGSVNGQVKVTVKVKDQAGNVGTKVAFIELQVGGGYAVSGMVTVPGGSSGIYDGEPAIFTRSDTIQLNLSYEGAAFMRIGIEGFPYSEWEPYSPNRKLTLPKSSGLVTLTVMAKDAAGTLFAPVKLNVVVDPVAPTIHLLRGLNGATATTGASIALEINVSDNLSGQFYYQYQVNGGSFSSWLPLIGSTISVFGLSPGANSITVNVKDQAGNVSSATVTIFRI